MQPAFASTLQRQGYQDLPGWAADDHDLALATFRRSCREILEEGSGFSRPVEFGGERSDWVSLCTEASLAIDARLFFEENFRAYKVVDEERPEGLFTGYYEPEVQGSLLPDEVFNIPIYRKPPDLVSFDQAQKKLVRLDYGRVVDGEPKAYFSREQIEKGVLQGQGLELVWLRDWADAFFIHVQGSGRVRLADGSVMRLTYAAKSGRDYASIGALLAERGAFPKDHMSMQVIRTWMDGHPQEARELMWKNESFIFFRNIQLDDPELGALGAQHLQLTPQRSLAVDRSIWMFGTPVWLEVEVPSGENGTPQPFRKLLIAQDTGTAIRGHARGDVFWGSGEIAGAVAGRMKSPGTMVVLLPTTVARRLGLAP